MRSLDSRIHKILMLVASIMTIGTVGYMLLSHYSFIDALYMTVITVTTVGFGELKPFTPEEKVFTIFLILTSITVFGYAVSSFSEYLVSGKLFDHFKHKRVKKQIEKLEGHTIICGYGRNGKQSILKLKNYGKQYVVIEKSKNLTEKLDLDGVLNVEGDSTTDEILLKAGLATNADADVANARDTAKDSFMVK